MAELYFKIGADWDNVKRLRDEISKLEAQLKGFGRNVPDEEVKTVEKRLSSARQEFTAVATEAAKAGNTINNDFKRKIYDASLSVNGLSAKIIEQKRVVKEVEHDVRRLGEAYRTALKNDKYGSSANQALKEYNAARKALDEEKASLFNLNQERATAQLSVKKLRDEYQLMRSEAEESGGAFDDMIGKLKGWGVAALGGVGIKEMASQIVRVRGEFQDMQTAIETLVGKDIAGELIPQIKELSKVSPLTLTDLIDAEKTMLGFNIEADKTIDYLKALSDVSMGNSQKFNSLTLSFSQMSATNKLMGQDLNQMINAGFNPLQVIAEKTGRSIAELKEEMSKGAISAEMVQQAFLDATSAGGKFYKMSENASKAINGQISMMEDAMDAAFNQMGEATEDVIMGGIKATTALIESWETVGKVVVSVAATYGAYRAALIAVVAAEKIAALSRLAAITHTNILTVATRQLTTAMAALNVVTKANPWVLLATVVVGAATALWSMADTTSAAERATESLADKKQKLAEAEAAHKQEVENLLTVLESEVASEEDRSRALVELESKYPGIFKQYDTEYEKLKNLKAIKEEIARLDANRVQGSSAIYKTNNKEIEALEAALRIRNSKGKEGDIDVYKGVHTNELMKRLSTLKEENKIIKKEVDEQTRVANMTGDKLSKLSKQQLQAAIKAREQALETAKVRAAQGGGKRNSYIKGGYNAGLKTLDQVQAELQQFEAELSKRNATRKTSSEWQNDARTEYNKAQQAYDDFIAGNEKMSAEEYEKKKERLKADLDKAKKKLGVNTGGPNKSYQATTKKEIESSALEIRQILLNLEDETTTKRIEQIHLDYDKAIAEVKKKEKELREARGGQLTEEDTNLLNAKTLAAEKNKDKALAAIRKEELEAMRNYLKEYGTLEQQRLAITEEYAEKIRNAQTEGERKTLRQEEKRDLSAINAQYFKQQIDWSSVLGEFGTMFRSEIKHNLELISGYMQEDEFKNMLPTDQQTIIDARNRLEEGLGGSLADVSFKKIGQLVSEFEANMAAYNLAKETEKGITENLIKAQEDYKKALKTGDQAQIKAAKTTLDAAQNQADMQASIVKGAEQALSDSATSLSDANRKAVTAINGVADALVAIKSGSLQQAYNGIGNLAGSLADVATGGLKDVLSSISEAFGVPMVDAVLGVVDLLKDGISTIIVDLLNMVTNAVNGILSDILSGDIITEVLKANYKGVGKILNTITFGGLNSWLGVGGNAAEVQATIDRLTDRNELLTTAVENLTEEMEVNRGMMTVQQAKQAQQYQREKEENLKEIAQAQASYSSSHHSWNYYWGGFTEAEIAKFSEKIGRQWDGDIWSLSPSEMKELQSTVDMWNKIQQTGEGGYGGRVTERLEDYIAEAGKLEEITDQLNETMTSISFKGLYDGFIDSLMDMEKSAEDIADNIVEYFQRAMLSYSIGEAMYEDLEAWYQKYAEYAEEGLTSREIEELEKEYQKFVEEGVRRRDEIASLTGYDNTFKDSESATSKGIENITSEQANALEGIMTAIQIAVEQGNDIRRTDSAVLSMLTLRMEDIIRMAAENAYAFDGISDILANSYLELQGINNNTKHLKTMSEDLVEIRRIIKNNY